MRIVLCSLDNLSASFDDPDVDDSAPLDTYALPLGEGLGLRSYDFEGSRRDEDAGGEVVRIYRERRPGPPVSRDVTLTVNEATGKVEATFGSVPERRPL